VPAGELAPGTALKARATQAEESAAYYSLAETLRVNKEARERELEDAEMNKRGETS
jgi:hypothetical protein